jgi:hypothetical protein
MCQTGLRDDLRDEMKSRQIQVSTGGGNVSTGFDPAVCNPKLQFSSISE